MGAEASVAEHVGEDEQAGSTTSSVSGSVKMGRRSRALRHSRQKQAAAAAAAAAVLNGQPPNVPDKADTSSKCQEKKNGSKSETVSLAGSPSKLRRGLRGLKHSVQRRFSFSSTSTLNDFDSDSCNTSRRNSICQQHKLTAGSRHLEPQDSALVVSTSNTGNRICYIVTICISNIIYMPVLKDELRF